jgi:hypothetical protein
MKVSGKGKKPMGHAVQRTDTINPIFQNSDGSWRKNPIKHKGKRFLFNNEDEGVGTFNEVVYPRMRKVKLAPKRNAKGTMTKRKYSGYTKN